MSGLQSSVLLYTQNGVLSLLVSVTGDYFLPKCISSFGAPPGSGLQGLGSSGKVGPEPLPLCRTHLASVAWRSPGCTCPHGMLAPQQQAGKEGDHAGTQRPGVGTGGQGCEHQEWRPHSGEAPGVVGTGHGSRQAPLPHPRAIQA